MKSAFLLDSGIKAARNIRATKCDTAKPTLAMLH